MPKHALSFKHLVSTSWSNSSSSSSSRDREKSVNELLASARANYLRYGGGRAAGQGRDTAGSRGTGAVGAVGPVRAASQGGSGSRRDAPPHVQERVWVPSQIGVGAAGGIELEDTGIHPAELLRQANIAARAASRNIAGPAPPPSWRAPRHKPSEPTTSRHPPASEGRVTRAHLVQAASLFTRSSLLNPDDNGASGSGDGTREKGGVPRLIELCVRVVLRHLEDTTEWEYLDDEGSGGCEEGDGEGAESDLGGEKVVTVGTVQIGAIVRAQAAFLDTHLRATILSSSALEPEGSPLRLSDRCIRLLVESSAPALSETDLAPLTLDPSSPTDLIPSSASSSASSADWESDTSMPSNLTHLPLPLQPSPQFLLRELSSSISSLASLDLSYSTLPVDLERLVSALPAGLRELSLAGVRVRTSRGKGSLATQVEFGNNDWNRGLAMMGRKLIVLQILDLSFFPVVITASVLSALLHPPDIRLPSLRLLGLREFSRFPIEDDVRTHDETQGAGSDVLSASSPWPVINGVVQTPPPRSEGRRELLLIIRYDRQRWVDVVWD